MIKGNMLQEIEGLKLIINTQNKEKQGLLVEIDELKLEYNSCLNRIK